MKLSLDKPELCSYYARQLNNFFPDGKEISTAEVGAIIDHALERLDHCFSHVAFRRYNHDGHTLYNHLYADHNIVFNWFLSNTAFKNAANQDLSNKLYYLNKVMHGFDCMYDTALPDIFLVFHGVGTMLGKAAYNDFFVVLQGCTVGSHKGQYPTFGKGVALTANSSIIGNCMIGNRVSISTRTTVFAKNILDDHAVYMDWEAGVTKVKPTPECYAQQFFITDLKNVS